MIVRLVALSLALVCLAAIAGAQDSATLTVNVFDPSAAVVPGASVTLSDLHRGTITHDETKALGFAVFDFLTPGEYSVEVNKTGFQVYRIDRLTLDIRDRRTLHIDLAITAAAGASVQVTAHAEALSSDAAQGVALEQNYIENLPANGRNAESLILMAPGISSAAGGKGGDGGFNANGLRSNTNYYTLDGVSMNRGGGGGPGGGGMGGPMGGGGAPPGAGGSATEMISIDALQEMKVQTSSFAPEFGRSPGAQIVMSSRGGTNGFHGSVFYYKRSDAFDANDWFANAGGYPKGKERQDRPGGTFGGPILKNKTFFFVNFEKVDLMTPQSVIADVPDMDTRASASAALRPYLNAFPKPNSTNLGSGVAEFRTVISNPSQSNSGSIRIDHAWTDRTTVFARYSLTPSNSNGRSSQMSAPNILNTSSSRSHTATLGVTHLFTGGAVNDLRANYSKSSMSSYSIMDNFGGAVPLTDSQVFPKGVTSQTGSFSLNILGVSGYSIGNRMGSGQEQVNVVDSVTRVEGQHNLKAGVDYRRIMQTSHRLPYSASASFNGLMDEDQSFLKGVALNAQVTSMLTAVYPTTSNFSAYAQDTWRGTDRTTLTYGLRWDVNPAPTTRSGPKPFALATSNIAGVTQNEPMYPTRWFDVAPRFGVAYLSDPTPGHEMMLRAGAGIFYDMGYGVVDSAFAGAPYSNVRTLSEVKFPLTAANLAAPAMPPKRPYGQVTTGGSDLKSPVVIQWNGTWEKYFGAGQMLSVAVVGSKGRRLMRTETQPSFSDAYDILRLTSNGSSSDYNGLQIQFRKRMSSSLQTQLSYTWGHSIDSSSNDAGFGGGFASLFGSGERGPSDYDVRQTVSFSGSWRLPGPRHGIVFYPLRHWYLDFVASARSGLPFDVQGVSSETSSSSSSSRGLFAQVRPDYNGLAVWISDPKVPGGRRLNKAAFTVPDGYAQGNLGRNAIRGFTYSQLDLSLRRMIPLGERARLNLAVQGYNILNHPNFANPSALEGGNMSSANFGVVTRMLNQGFGGGVNSLYRSGGPRSMEASVRLQF